MLVYCEIWNDDKPEKTYNCLIEESELNITVKNCANKHGWSTIRTRCFTMSFDLYIQSLKQNAIDFQ
jgi:hypothetical protein